MPKLDKVYWAGTGRVYDVVGMAFAKEDETDGVTLGQFVLLLRDKDGNLESVRADFCTAIQPKLETQKENG